jgi:hypothetical protein
MRLVVTGDNVTAYGLAVEHYQKSEVLWTGQGGIDSVVNGVGGPVTSTSPGTVVPVDVTSYP